LKKSELRQIIKEELLRETKQPKEFIGAKIEDIRFDDFGSGSWVIRTNKGSFWFVGVKEKAWGNK